MLAAVDQDATSLDLAVACERTTVVDEYGFEDEIVVCPDGEPPLGDGFEWSADGPLDLDRVVDADGALPTWVLDRLVTALPTDAGDGPAGDVSSELTALAATADELDSWCGTSLGEWAATLGRASEQAENLAARLTAATAEDDADVNGAATADAGTETAASSLIGSTHGRAIGRALFERVVLETGCASPGAAAVGYEQAVDEGLLAATSRAAMAVTELDRVLSGALSGQLFHTYSTLPNYEWLRTQREPVELVVLGTSQAGASIDVPALAEGTGRSVGNAFLPGSLAEVQRHWVPEVLRYVDPDRVVWLVGAIDLLIDCDDLGREQQFLERLTNRRAAFARSGWFRTIDEIEVVLGPAGAVNHNRGNAAKEPVPDPTAIEAQRVDYGDAMADPGFCGQRAAVIADTAASLAAEGRDVVVVGMPVSPRMAELQPDVEQLTAVGARPPAGRAPRRLPLAWSTCRARSATPSCGPT